MPFNQNVHNSDIILSRQQRVAVLKAFCCELCSSRTPPKVETLISGECRRVNEHTNDFYFIHRVKCKCLQLWWGQLGPALEIANSRLVHWDWITHLSKVSSSFLRLRAGRFGGDSRYIQCSSVFAFPLYLQCLLCRFYWHFCWGAKVIWARSWPHSVEAKNARNLTSATRIWFYCAIIDTGMISSPSVRTCRGISCRLVEATHALCNLTPSCIAVVCCRLLSMYGATREVFVRACRSFPARRCNNVSCSTCSTQYELCRVWRSVSRLFGIENVFRLPASRVKMCPLFLN
jgi:hypothetical protein